MFKVYFVNFFYFAPQQFPTVAAALAYAKDKCFEASIWQDDKLVAFWGPISGTRIY